MTSSEARAIFLEFFRSRGHRVVPSSSLIPANDPSLLFTNAGMVQFKSVFLGQETLPFSRAASSQKCVRAGGKHNDLENVGHTARHHTFFEMLGNFSFGDYFKKEAIEFAWELLTAHYGLPKDKLWATVYEDDDEAADLWKEFTGIPAERIVRLGAKDNFWQMGDTGPCGPCSEIIIDQGSEIGCGRPDCGVGCECDRYLEIWNLVFMQYDRDRSGQLNPLPKPSIDTGMGLERLSAVLQGKLNNFDSDLFGPIISAICGYSGKKYGKDRTTDTAIRVIADHIRSITFLLSEGLVPSNEGRGYVLRRIIRRASRYAKSLDIADPVLYRLCDSVVASLPVYPELAEEEQRVKKMLRLEEERFNKTLEQGISLINDIIKDVKNSGGRAVPGDELFKLYDTYGFPLDIARDVAAENGLEIDEPGFHKAMEAQKARARGAWSVEEPEAFSLYRELLQQTGTTTEFVGYESMESESTVLGIINKGALVDAAKAGDEVEIVLDRSPFYAESGGQVGDSGVLRGEGLKAVVTDTKKPVEGLHVHSVRVIRGSLKTGQKVRSSVDREKRLATMRNHTATHLLHSSLRNILGEHVKQAGSYVSPERLRFDFTHFSSLERELIDAVEDEVNENVLKNIEVVTKVMETKKAIESGVMALFGEKYGDIVRVVTVPGVSSELCGGTHTRATGDIGVFRIISEGSVASGIRRVEAVTGTEALRTLRSGERELRKISDLLKTSENPSERLSKLLLEMKDLEKTLEKLKGRSAAESSGRILEDIRTIDGVKVIAKRIDGLDLKDLRVMADNVRNGLGSGILLLASAKDGQASLVAMVTKDLTARYSAGELLKKVAAEAGGRGGGKADIAQGGTREIDKLDKALESLYGLIKA